MKQIFIFTLILMAIAGCSKTSNPVSPPSDTVQSGNLQFTFSIPQSTYGTRDTLVASMKVYNPEDTAVSFHVPVCWPIAWFTVVDSSGTTRLSYSAPSDLGCNSIAIYKISPHQSQQIFLLQVEFPIVALDSTKKLQSSYVLTVKNVVGTFSLKFAVD